MFKRINDEFSPSAYTLKWMNRCRMQEMNLGGMNREGLRTEHAPYGYSMDFIFTIIVLILEIGTAIWIGERRSHGLGYNPITTWGFIVTIIVLDFFLAYLHIRWKSNIKVFELQNKYLEYNDSNDEQINHNDQSISRLKTLSIIAAILIVFMALVKMYFTNQSVIGSVGADKISIISSAIYIAIAAIHIAFTGYIWAAWMTKISYLRDKRVFNNPKNKSELRHDSIELNGDLDYTGIPSKNDRKLLKSLYLEEDSINKQVLLYAKGCVSDEEIDLVFSDIKNRDAQREFAYASLELQLRNVNM